MLYLSGVFCSLGEEFLDPLCFLLQCYSFNNTYNHLPQTFNSDTFLLTAPACWDNILERQHSTSTLATFNIIPTFWSQWGQTSESIPLGLPNSDNSFFLQAVLGSWMPAASPTGQPMIGWPSWWGEWCLNLGCLRASSSSSSPGECLQSAATKVKD